MLIYHLHTTGQIHKPNLILMDSHYSHVFNYCYMAMMYDRLVKVFAIEPHSSHWGQPLDKNPFLGFKHAFNEAIRKFNHATCGRGITKSEFFSVFNIAWEKAMTPSNIKAGFKRTGIWPINRAAIPSYVSEPSKMCEFLSSLGVFVLNCSPIELLLLCSGTTRLMEKFHVIWFRCLKHNSRSICFQLPKVPEVMPLPLCPC